MTAENTDSDGSMTQARAYAEKAMTQEPFPQPRRYIARRLHDSMHLTEREVAEVLGVSQKTVNRDLQITRAPLTRLESGAVAYAANRFVDDSDWQGRVSELEELMPPHNARVQASREFAGPPFSPLKVIRTTEEQRKLREAAIKAASK